MTRGAASARRNKPRCSAFASHDQDSQEEKEEGGAYTAEGAKQAQANGNGGGWETGRDTARPNHHCGGSSAEVAIRLLAARSDEMVDAARYAILNTGLAEAIGITFQQVQK